MSSQTETEPRNTSDTLSELVRYAALLDDLTSRKCAEDVLLSDDGVRGLNQLAHHMRLLAIEAWGHVPMNQ